MAHENGIYTIKDNKIFCTVSDVHPEHMGIIIDTKTGTVIKTGKYQVLSNNWDFMQKTLTGFDLVTDFLLLELDNNTLTLDEICTFTNYIRNSLEPEKANEMLDLLETEAIHEKLKQLAELGW